VRNESVSTTIEILNVPVSALSMERTIDRIAGWVGRGVGRYVCAIDVYNLVLSRHDIAHRTSLANADIVTADGVPLVWVGRMKGARGMERVCGPDLLPAVCARSVKEGWSHYFYGGADGVALDLARRLERRYPGLKVAGCESPPFRPLSVDERDAMVKRIKASGADIVWVGLGCPKQEAWMRDHASLLSGQILIGIGAAFDFHTERVRRAPVWMRGRGLEWLHRLMSEPHRLWRRYVISAPTFVVLCACEAAGWLPKHSREAIDTASLD